MRGKIFFSKKEVKIMSSNEGIQGKIMRVEHALRHIGGDQYDGIASAVETLLGKYIAREKQSDFLDDLEKLVKNV